MESTGDKQKQSVLQRSISVIAFALMLMVVLFYVGLFETWGGRGLAVTCLGIFAGAVLLSTWAAERLCKAVGFENETPLMGNGYFIADIMTGFLLVGLGIALSLAGLAFDADQTRSLSIVFFAPGVLLILFSPQFLFGAPILAVGALLYKNSGPMKPWLKAVGIGIFIVAMLFGLASTILDKL